MDVAHIPVGKKSPHEVNVIIEVPMGSDPVKYELDKESGAIFVDRFIHTPMFYPCNYGFIPHTLSGDGDPVDVLVVCNHPVVPGAVLAARPIGVLLMEDESGEDEKLIAVPTTKINPFYEKVHALEDLPELLLSQIKHFFEHYKDLEKGKWVKVRGWENADKARSLIEEGIERAKKSKAA
ncbi:MAG: inorganic diphosphatase [Alphaproteobacteria bacterium]|nr:inorganic diphosphatase [Alphaproteobacteria bacterium]